MRAAEALVSLRIFADSSEPDVIYTNIPSMPTFGKEIPILFIPLIIDVQAIFPSRRSRNILDV